MAVTLPAHLQPVGIAVVSGTADDLYVDGILYHAAHSRHRGSLDAPDLSAEDANPLCGDTIRVELSVRDGSIDVMRFSCQGCAISQASASMLAGLVEGRTVEAARDFDRQELLRALGVALGPSRLKCALLPLAVLRQALGISYARAPR